MITLPPLGPAVLTLLKPTEAVILNAACLGTYWNGADHDRLLKEAKSQQGAMDDGDIDPTAFQWRLVLDLPTSIFIPLMANERSWCDWFNDEVLHSQYGPTYHLLLEEPLDDPIVSTIEPHRIQIWDGWHRVASRIVMREPSLPVIVGFQGDLHTIVENHITF